MNAISTAHRFPAGARPGLPWLLLGGATAAGLDLGFATLFWAELDVPAIRVPQSIAGWLMGPSAFEGGLGTALLGALLYVCTMCVVVAGYHAGSRRWPVLRHQPMRCGAAYGVLAYILILEIAVPLLGATEPAARRLDWTLACVVAYMLLVGIPAALFSRQAWRHAR